MRTRQQLIDAGKIWQLYPAVNKEDILCEGTESKVRKYARKFRRQIMRGEIRIAKVIWEIIPANQ